MTEDELRMTFTEHLGELRTRLIRSGSCVIIMFFVSYAFSNQLFAIVARPISPIQYSKIFVKDKDKETSGAPPVPTKVGEETTPHTDPPDKGVTAYPKWVVLNPFEAFVMKFKLAMYASLLLSFPYILWQICAFIFPGLKPNERKIIQFLIGGCSILACAGVALGYFGIFPVVLPYLLEYAQVSGIEVQLRMSETIQLLLMGLAGFAIAFQFPMVSLILVYMGLVTPQAIAKHWRIITVVIAVASAVLTPSPDPVSMMIMMVPLMVLYGLTIILSFTVVKRKKQAAGAAA